VKRRRSEMTVRKEEFRVDPADLANKVKELIHEGNVRRVIVRNGEGQTVMEIPVTAGVVVAVIAPILTALGAIAALAAEWSIEVQRTSEDGETKG
jgi:predicted regulator of Ras-like GTPase activity (Roadblock/LC7/MglB family)